MLDHLKWSADIGYRALWLVTATQRIQQIDEGHSPPLTVPPDQSQCQCPPKRRGAQLVERGVEASSRARPGPFLYSILGMHADEDKRSSGLTLKAQISEEATN